jgi:hypothetical protein
MHAFVSLDVTVSAPGGGGGECPRWGGEEITAIPTHMPLGGLDCAVEMKRNTRNSGNCISG